MSEISQQLGQGGGGEGGGAGGGGAEGGGQQGGTGGQAGVQGGSVQGASVQGGGQQGAAGEANQPASPAPWMQDFGDEKLRSDPTLARYDSPEKLAKAFLETRDWAKGRVAIPDKDDPASLQEFASKMRPESADKYEIPLPEGTESSPRADRFRDKAFELGLTPHQAVELAIFDNTMMAEAQEQFGGKAKQELEGLRIELTDPIYQRNLQAVSNMLEARRGDAGAGVSALESAYGARAGMELLFWLASKTGELERVDPGDIQLKLGEMTPEQAKREQDRFSQDSAFMAQARIKGTPENEKWKQLNAAQVPKRA